MRIDEYIEIDLSKRLGKPFIKGTRISVYDVLNWLANGMDKKDIIKDFLVLSETQIHACLAYAASREYKINIVS